LSKSLFGRTRIYEASVISGLLESPATLSKAAGRDRQQVADSAILRLKETGR
jgi:hypothetical protein